MAEKSLTVREIAAEVGGEGEGDLERPIEDVKPIAEAGPRDITFVANQRYEQEFARTLAGCVVIPSKLANGDRRTVIRHANPYLAFAKLVALLRPPAPRPAPGVHPSAVVAPSARLGRDVAIEAGAVVAEGASVGDRATIGALAYVGPGASVGEDARLYPRAVIYHGVSLGKRVIVHSGAVVGSDGFGYASDPTTGRHEKIPQVGTVVVEDDVEIGANTTIDRAVLGATRIGRGTKIDNLVQIAHNVEIGPDSLLVAQCGISGSTRLGRGVIVAAQAGIVGHIDLGDRAIVAASAGVTKDVAAGEAVLGQPAIPIEDGRRAYALIGRLPEIKKAVAALEKRLTKLEEAAATEDAAGKGEESRDRGAM
jgi:UDP-3-O-[3-hydroxymyristoyl] glucosamine N-acyltransferase